MYDTQREFLLIFILIEQYYIVYLFAQNILSSRILEHKFLKMYDNEW